MGLMRNGLGRCTPLLRVRENRFVVRLEMSTKFDVKHVKFLEAIAAIAA